MSVTAPAPLTAAADLSLTRLHLMRAGYLLMGAGLALVKWPLARGGSASRQQRRTFTTSS